LSGPESTEEGSAAGAQAGLRRVAISSGAQVAGTLLAGVIAVAVLRIMTSELGAGGYGQYIILLSFVYGAAVLVDFGLNGVTFAEIAREPERAGQILGRNLGFRCVLGIGAIPVVLALIYLLYPTQRGHLFLPAVLFSVDILLTVVQTTVLSYYGARVRSEIAAAILLAGRCLFLLFVYGSSRLSLGLAGIVEAFVSADAITAVLSVILVQRAVRISLKFQPREWWALLKRAAPLGALQVANTLYVYVDSVMLSLLSSNRNVVLYALAFNVIFLIGTFSVTFAAALVPGLAISNPEQVHHTVERALYVMFCVAAVFSVGGVLLAHGLVVLLGGADFAGGATAFSILSLSLLFTFPGTLLIYACISVSRYGRLVVVAGSVLLANLLLNLALIPLLGVNGAAIALVAAEALTAVAVYFVFRDYARRSLSLLPLWRPVLAAVAMLLVGLANVVVEGALVTVVYATVLAAVGGVPLDVWQLIGLKRGSGTPPPEADAKTGSVPAPERRSLK
jgi:O-antigen/teichoic acid export membrane protein